MKYSESLIYNICNRCNLRCKHCSNAGLIHDTQVMDSNMVFDSLTDAAEVGIAQVTFVGGEPFLELGSLRKYIQRAKALGLETCIITNTYWAKTKETAIEILKSLEGLTSLLISSDLYHLEYISADIIMNAIEACLELNINAAINATCASKKDKKKIWEIYEKYKNKIFIHTHMLMPIGAAKELEIERWMLEDKVNRLPGICGIGNFLIEMNGDVHACCNAILAKDSYLYAGNLNEESLKEILHRFHMNPMYQFIRKQGPRGIGRMLQTSPYYELCRTREYTCECDFCVDVLGNRKFYESLESMLIR